MLDTQATTDTALLTVPQAAHEARVSREHMYRLVRVDEVAAIRVGEHGPLSLLAEPFRAWLHGDQLERA